MGLNINFTSASLGPDEDGQQRLTVQGKTVPAEGITAIHVVIPRGDSGVITSKVAAGKLLEDWEARFPEDGQPPLDPPITETEVTVVGVAMRNTCEPFVWQGSFEVETTQ